ncbi:M1 family aminopeptidase [Negadavirga shengliensis]|uniref:Aminopeptidase N n=1 Tax=Negadavirga shengliensis TaxID=1389218 RepID=A0ABV9SY83_9BACT
MPSFRFKVCHFFLLLIIGVFSCKSTEVATEEAGQPIDTPIESPTDTVIFPKQDTLRRYKEALIKEYRSSRERNFDLLHTSLDLRFDYGNQFVLGKAMLKLKPYFYEQELLVLDAKDFDIHEVWLEDQKESVPLAFNYDQKQIKIFLPNAFTREDSLEIGVRYTAKPEEGKREGSRALTDTKGLYFINPDGSDPHKPVQIWTQGETEHSSKWFPTIDSPNERQTQEIKLTVDERFLTLSNGQLINKTLNEDGTRTDHWYMDLPHAPYLAAIVVGEFEQLTDSWNGLEVNYYVESKYKEGASKVFQHTPEMIGFFSDLLGVPFPWQKYDQVVVRDFVSGAMENTTVSIFMDALNLNEREGVDSEWDYIIAHELFHQWFGNYVTAESWSNLPLNESFADYSEYLWFEHKEGRDQADMHHFNAMEQYLNEAREKQENLIRYYYQDAEDMFDSHSYAKGGRVLHMLRQYLGDDAFFASLNHYLTENAFSSVEIHDLRRAFEEVSGKDLNWFFNQWFLDSGHPFLEIKMDNSIPENVVLTLRQKQDLTETPLYRIPFTVSIYKGSEKTEKVFLMEEGVQQFALENGADTDLIIVDEHMTLLGERESYRGVDYLTKQWQISRSGLARVEALDSLTNTFSDRADLGPILTASLTDPFHVVRELALHRMPSLLGKNNLDPDTEEKIFDLAENDPKNAVRAAAIEALGFFEPSKYEGLFLRLINDPSYYVAGAALTAFMDLDGNQERKKEVFTRLEEENNIRIIAPLADYLTSSKASGYSDWFHRKLAGLTGESLYYFMGYYGDYFASVEGTDRDKAIEMMYGLASSHQANYVRLSAFQALFGFIEEEEVLHKAISLYEKETDTLVKRYQMFYLEPYMDEN